MDRYCKFECQDRGNEGCKLPSNEEVLVARGRIALRGALEMFARMGREPGDERIRADWGLNAAVNDFEMMNQRVKSCIERHRFGEDAVVIQLRAKS